MKVIICGAGQVGSNIARYLATENNDVTVIDQSPELIQKISDTLDVQAMVGFASHPNVLEQAGAADADMIIAVTHGRRSQHGRLPGRPLAVQRADQDRPRPQSELSGPIGPTCSRASTCRSTSSSRRRSRSPAPSPAALQVPGRFDMIPLADGKVRLIGVICADRLPDPEHAAAPAHRPVPRPQPRGRRHRPQRPADHARRRRPDAARRRGLFRRRHPRT